MSSSKNNTIEEIKNKAGRPRCEKTHCLILKSAIDIINEDGYDKANFQTIAKRAGVGRQTLYRWWSNKEEIILEAFNELVACPDESCGCSDFSGDVREDLLLVANLTIETFKKNSKLLKGLFSDALLCEKFRDKFKSEFMGKRKQNIAVIITQAKDSGKISKDYDLSLFYDIFFGPILQRLFFSEDKLNDKFTKDLVNTLLKDCGCK